MSRARLLSALATVATLCGFFAVWSVAPSVISVVGLGRFELLARVLLVFAALGLADKAMTFLATRQLQTDQTRSKESRNDH